MITQPFLSLRSELNNQMIIMTRQLTSSTPLRLNGTHRPLLTVKPNQTNQKDKDWGRGEGGREEEGENHSLADELL